MDQVVQELDINLKKRSVNVILAENDTTPTTTPTSKPSARRSSGTADSIGGALGTILTIGVCIVYSIHINFLNTVLLLFLCGFNSLCDLWSNV